jgi:ABC-type Fe3+/spermidine/putrescine transport system ATPase subunit
MLYVEQITRAFDGKPALRDVSVDVKAGEIVCLLGPSGCGKTTLLRICAGLETPDRGKIWFNDTDITHLPVHQRDFGLMFQDYALFPHLNVAQNVTFGLKMHRTPRSIQAERLRETLALVGLTGFERRDVTSLSGGERQRVALARSLAVQPRVLMLDEPLGALDAALKDRLALELRAIIQTVRVPTLYVTHDQREAFAVADRVAVMNSGRIVQIDPPAALYRQPKTPFVARFLGMNNIISAEIDEDGRAVTRFGTFSGGASSILFHPDAISIAPNSPIRARVREIVFWGEIFRITVEVDGQTLTFRQAAIHIPPNVGDSIGLQIDPAFVVPLMQDQAD